MSTPDDDDGQPYGVIGEASPPPCPSCGQTPDRGATVCRHCDTDLATGRKAVRTQTPLVREWEGGWPFRRRLAAFLICQVINVVTVVLSLALRGNAPVTAVGFVMASVLQAFALGTFDRLTLTRTAKGKVTLTKAWRVAFVPLAPATIRWREHESVTVRHSDIGCLEWGMLWVLLPTLLPALLWWWFAIRPGRVAVALCQNLGDPVTPLYLGTDVDRAEEIAETIRDVTGLPFNRS